MSPWRSRMWNFTENREVYPLRRRASAAQGVLAYAWARSAPWRASSPVRATKAACQDRRRRRRAGSRRPCRCGCVPVLGDEVEHGEPAEPARVVEQVPARHRLAREARNALSRAGSRRRQDRVLPWPPRRSARSRARTPRRAGARWSTRGAAGGRINRLAASRASRSPRCHGPRPPARSQ